MKNKTKKKKAVVALIEKEGRYLLIKRAEGLSAAGWWCLPGGRVERGESLEQAVKREIQEEVGLHFEPRKLIWECSLEGLDFYLYWFNGQAKMGSITLSPKEAEAFEWMSKQAILEHAKVLPRTKEFFEKIIK